MSWVETEISLGLARPNSHLDWNWAKSGFTADQIQTWQKVQSNAPDKFSKVEFKFSASTETWHGF